MYQTQTQLTATQLGHTGLEITRVGFGAWAVGFTSRCQARFGHPR
jgi:aryl-alcohol dehydrogenase-like predicted oxidoreductase